MDSLRLTGLRARDLLYVYACIDIATFQRKSLLLYSASAHELHPFVNLHPNNGKRSHNILECIGLMTILIGDYDLEFGTLRWRYDCYRCPTGTPTKRHCRPYP